MPAIRESGQLTTMKESDESLGNLLSELASHSAGLVQDEFMLARQEITEKVKSYRSAIILLAVGSVVTFLAMMVLTTALILWIGTQIEPWLAALLTGAGLGVVGAIILLLAKTELGQLTLRPEKTIRTLEENKEWLKDIT